MLTNPTPPSFGTAINEARAERLAKIKQLQLELDEIARLEARRDHILNAPRIWLPRNPPQWDHQHKILITDGTPAGSAVIDFSPKSEAEDNAAEQQLVTNGDPPLTVEQMEQTMREAYAAAEEWDKRENAEAAGKPWPNYLPEPEPAYFRRHEHADTIRVQRPPVPPAPRPAEYIHFFLRDEDGRLFGRLELDHEEIRNMMQYALGRQSVVRLHRVPEDEQDAKIAEPIAYLDRGLMAHLARAMSKSIVENYDLDTQLFVSPATNGHFTAVDQLAEPEDQDQW